MHIIGLICVIILIILLIYHWAQTLTFVLCCGAAIALTVWLLKKGKEKNLTPKNNWVKAGTAGSSLLLFLTIILSFITKKMWHSREATSIKYDGTPLYSSYHSENFSLWQIDKAIPAVIISFCFVAIGILLLYLQGKRNPKKKINPRTPEYPLPDSKSVFLGCCVCYCHFIAILIICMTGLFIGPTSSSASGSGGGISYVEIDSFGLGAGGVLIILMIVANGIFMAVNAYMFWKLHNFPPKNAPVDNIEEVQQ